MIIFSCVVFPEMKTAIRTYHPIPALQKTEGNLQDAPRIKHILKASFLAEESNIPPITPQDIISRSVSNNRKRIYRTLSETLVRMRGEDPRPALPTCYSF
jgi:hypothetical protein